MRDAIYLLFHLLTTLAKLVRPGGSRTVIAENLLLKQQPIKTKNTLRRPSKSHCRRHRWLLPTLLQIACVCTAGEIWDESLMDSRITLMHPLPADLQYRDS